MLAVKVEMVLSLRNDLTVEATSFATMALWLLRNGMLVGGDDACQ